LISINLIGQDTNYIDNPSKYFSYTEDSLRFKCIKGPRVDYSRELIKFSDSQYKIENCYYFDGKRFTNYFSTDFIFINDSILGINKEKWHFEKRNYTLFDVNKLEIEYIEKGTVLVHLSLLQKMVILYLVI